MCVCVHEKKGRWLSKVRGYQTDGVHAGSEVQDSKRVRDTKRERQGERYRYIDV